MTVAQARSGAHTRNRAAASSPADSASECQHDRVVGRQWFELPKQSVGGRCSDHRTGTQARNGARA